MRAAQARFYLFDATADHAIRQIEALGGVRQDAPWDSLWKCASLPEGNVSFWVSASSRDDCTRLRLGHTIPPLLELRVEQIESLFRPLRVGFGHKGLAPELPRPVLGFRIPEVFERARLVVSARARGGPGLQILHGCALSMLTAFDGIVQDEVTLRVWTSHEVRESAGKVVALGRPFGQILVLVTGSSTRAVGETLRSFGVVPTDDEWLCAAAKIIGGSSWDYPSDGLPTLEILLREWPFREPPPGSFPRDPCPQREGAPDDWLSLTKLLTGTPSAAVSAMAYEAPGALDALHQCAAVLLAAHVGIAKDTSAARLWTSDTLAHG